MASRRLLTRRGWTLVGAALGLFVAGRILGTVELSALATGAFLLLLASALWVRSRSLELVAARQVRPARLQVGSDGRVDLVIANRGFRRTPQLTVTDAFDDGRRAARFLLPPLPPDETARAAYRVPTDRRGRYRVGPLAVGVTDPFGLARRAWMIDEVDEVIVRPRVHDLLSPTQAAGRLSASVESRRARALPSESGEEFLTLRDYEVGDDLRRIHWRSTARTGDLVVRQNEAQWRPRAVIVLDVRPEAHGGDSFEIAVEATASVLHELGVRTGRRVEVVTSAGSRLGARSPTGAARPPDVLDQLATIEPNGPDRLDTVLASLRTQPRPGLVVAVTGVLSLEQRQLLGALGAQTAVTLVTTRRQFGLAADGAPERVAGLFLIDASSVPFPIAWNEAMSRWHLAAPATSRPSHSPA